MTLAPGRWARVQATASGIGLEDSFRLDITAGPHDKVLQTT